MLISVAQALFLMPLCVEQLGMSVYGAWLGATELLIWIQFLDFGIPNLMAQRIGAAVGRDDRADAGRWFATCLAILLFVAAGLLGPAWSRRRSSRRGPRCRRPTPCDSRIAFA
jgi:O-antigen/teichoic acid export membrane protein